MSPRPKPTTRRELRKIRAARAADMVIRWIGEQLELLIEEYKLDTIVMRGGEHQGVYGLAIKGYRGDERHGRGAIIVKDGAARCYYGEYKPGEEGP